MAAIPRPAGVLPGPAASWGDLPEAARCRISLDDVRGAMADRAQATVLPGPHQATPLELPSRDGRPAAVLCLLFEESGETNVVLTRRSSHLRAHGGEVSFPGGRLRSGELPLHAALRETNEEIGLDTTTVEVIGELAPLTTLRSSALVYCFVGTFPGPGRDGQVLRPDASEVDRIFWVPLARLAEDGVFHEELWPARPSGGAGAEPPQYRAVPFFVLEDDIVWGATARLLTELVSQVLGRRGPRPR